MVSTDGRTDGRTDTEGYNIIPRHTLVAGYKKVYRQTNQQTDRQTNIITEKAKTVYPLYTSYCFFVTQYNSSSSSFVPNFRILTQVVAEKSLTEKKVYRQTDKPTNRQTNKHNYRKGKNCIPPIYFVLLFYYTIQLIIIKLCTKFQNPNPSSC